MIWVSIASASMHPQLLIHLGCECLIRQDWVAGLCLGFKGGWEHEHLAILALQGDEACFLLKTYAISYSP